MGGLKGGTHKKCSTSAIRGPLSFMAKDAWGAKDASPRTSGARDGRASRAEWGVEAAHRAVYPRDAGRAHLGCAARGRARG